MVPLFAITAGVVLFALFAPKRGQVIEVLPSGRRGLRVKWQGATGWPAGIPAPKFKVGQRVTIRNPADQGPDPAVEGKTAAILELVYSERGEQRGDAWVWEGKPGGWGYVLDLKVADQPVRVAETSLVPEGTKVGAGDDAEWLCGDLPLDRILASGVAGSGDAAAGYSWKKFGRALKKAAKWCWKNKWVKYGIAAAAQALNVVAPGAGVALGAAILIVDKATSKDKKTAEPELQKVQEIRNQADAGDPKAKEALETLTIVRDAQKEAAKEGINPPGAKAEPLPDLSEVL